MRTTLAIDDDVLAAAKALAEREGKTVGDVLTQLAREADRPLPGPHALAYGRQDLD